jgi:hypothetical protein
MCHGYVGSGFSRCWKWTALPHGAEINAWLAIDAEGNST